ncbi:hypothetical protein RRG08_050032 [Elysia crispata]|uniref:Uncharacterized protein n=1 Tax=Elysia crispata TaxID=231223 RepID=A0AAE1BB40_9GAST|nr:hypothetical protein RRG08_050032 [Elysia crispata]
MATDQTSPDHLVTENNHIDLCQLITQNKGTDFPQSCTLKSIWPGSRAEDPQLVEICALHHASDGEVLNFNAPTTGNLFRTNMESRCDDSSFSATTRYSGSNQGIKASPSSGDSALR